MAGISREADKERSGWRFTYYSGNVDAGNYRLKELYFHVTGTGALGKKTIGSAFGEYFCGKLICFAGEMPYLKAVCFEDEVEQRMIRFPH